MGPPKLTAGRFDYQHFTEQSIRQSAAQDLNLHPRRLVVATGRNQPNLLGTKPFQARLAPVTISA